MTGGQDQNYGTALLVSNGVNLTGTASARVSEGTVAPFFTPAPGTAMNLVMRTVDGDTVGSSSLGHQRREQARTRLSHSSTHNGYQSSWESRTQPGYPTSAVRYLMRGTMPPHTRRSSTRHAAHIIWQKQLDLHKLLFMYQNRLPMRTSQ